MMFLVFSYTGVAILNVSAVSSETSLETVHNIKLQFAVESAENEALWKLNSGADSLVNFTSDGVTCSWDPYTDKLTVSAERYSLESTIELELSEDSHFKHAIATAGNIDLDWYQPVVSDDHAIKSGFGFLPGVDFDYFSERAISIEKEPGKITGKGKKNNSGSELFLEDGIHIFTGSNIRVENVRLNSGTLVFTDKNVTFSGTNTIKTPPADTSGALPALVFLNSRQTFELYTDDGAKPSLEPSTVPEVLSFIMETFPVPCWFRMSTWETTITFWMMNTRHITSGTRVSVTKMTMTCPRPSSTGLRKNGV